MHPWIAEQANREHIAELRTLSRPFGVPLAGWRVGRRWFSRPQPMGSWLRVDRRNRRVSVRY